MNGDNQSRLEWEDYSLKNDGWVKEGMEIQKDDENYHGLLLDDYEPYGVIYENEGDATGPRPNGYLPIWMVSQEKLILVWISVLFSE